MLKDIAKTIVDQEKAKAEQAKRLDEERKALESALEEEKWRLVRLFYKEVAAMIHESEWITPCFVKEMRREEVSLSKSKEYPTSQWVTVRFYSPGFWCRLRNESGEVLLEKHAMSWKTSCHEDMIYKRTLFKKAPINKALDIINRQAASFRERAVSPYQYIHICYSSRRGYCDKPTGSIILFSDGEAWHTDWGSSKDPELYCPYECMEYNVEDLKDEEKRKELAFLFAVEIMRTKVEHGVRNLYLGKGEKPLISLEYFRKVSRINYQEIVEKNNIK